ncbi:XdhC family protein [Clostridium sp. Marseille-Q7071]
MEKGNKISLSIITKACGSSPRGEGTMMAILEDGNIYETIGGEALGKIVI